MGPSGSGKSTLMHIIGCLDVPTSGTYLLAGEDVSVMSEADLADIRNRRIGFVFQQFNLLPSLTAQRNVELPLAYAGIDRAERRPRAERRTRSRRARGPQEPPSGRALGWAAAAGGHRPGPRERAGSHPGRRAHGQPRLGGGREILDLLAELHASGRTVVLITHDAGVADSADRIIQILDGSIHDRRDPPASDDRGIPMSWIETMRTGLEAVVTHRLRSSLTILGILIGIAAVILTVGLGEGAQAQVTSEVSSLGANLLIVSPGSTTSGSGVRGGLGRRVHLDHG